MADLDFVIIPLYEKMYLNANIVHTRVRGLIDSGILELSDSLIVRTYLTSIRSLKREAAANKSMNSELQDILLKIEAPQFVWCADIATPEQYQALQTSARIIIDSTAGTYERDPWLLWHNRKTIAYREKNGAASVKTDISPYPLYRNNLKEIYRK
ncbi:hypothetical protein [Chrysiogenes arsenatis]|uniref:hypothetical protein n=1 Tax=Chrysiogenes arsenatis TaxID=309797 RepID=UPI0012678726|nr:hypothetical protein [Chrysiogenes arsenatis]